MDSSPKEESIELEGQGKVLKSTGFEYILQNGELMVKYHVDACNEFQEKINRETRFGGTLSVRFSKGKKNTYCIWTQ